MAGHHVKDNCGGTTELADRSTGRRSQYTKLHQHRNYVLHAMTRSQSRNALWISQEEVSVQADEILTFFLVS